MKKRLIGYAAALLAVSMLAGCGAPAAGTGVAADPGSQAGASQPGTSQSGTSQAGTSQAGTSQTDASQSAGAEGASITFWHSMGGVNGEALEYLVNKFNSENTMGIQVEAQYQGEYDDAINKLKSAQIGNMGADLVQIYDIGTRFMIDSGWVVPMQELIDADGWDKTQIEPNIAAYYTVGDTLYSMPFNSSTPLLYYNMDMFDKAGITQAPGSLGEIGRIADDLVNKGGAGEPISLSIYGWFFEQFTCKQGLNYVNNGNGREAAATAVEFDQNGAGAKTLAAWKELYDKGYAPNVGRGGDAGLADFSSGKSAMTLGSTASLKQILEDVNGKFEAKKAATWEFVKFLVSPESQAYWNAQTGYFPVTVKAHEEPVFRENLEKYPQFGTAIDQLHDSAPQSAGALLSVFPEARQVVETEIENMLNNGTSPEEAASEMAQQINKAIGEYNLLNE